MNLSRFKPFKQYSFYDYSIYNQLFVNVTISLNEILLSISSCQLESRRYTTAASSFSDTFTRYYAPELVTNWNAVVGRNGRSMTSQDKAKIAGDNLGNDGKTEHGRGRAGTKIFYSQRLLKADDLFIRRHCCKCCQVQFSEGDEYRPWEVK